MKKSICIGLFVAATAVNPVFAQSIQPQPVPTPERVIVTNTMPYVPPAKMPTPVPPSTQAPIIVGGQPQPSQASNLTYKGLSFSQIKSKIAEAKRALQTRPLTTVMSEPMSLTSLVRIAYYDWNDKKVDYIVVGKDAFLTPDSATAAISSSATPSAPAL